MQNESAPFLRRLGARVLDLVFCYGLAFVLVIPVAIALIVPIILIEGEPERSLLTTFGAVLCLFLAYVATEVFLLVRREGQTLGKGLMGLRVVPVVDGIYRVPLGAAAVRLLVMLSPFVLVVISGSYPNVGVLNVLAILGMFALLASLILAVIPRSGQRRALHDYASRTRVVRAAKRKVDIRQDLRMAIPGKLDMVKRT